jgi:hypothetical protein
MLPLRVFNVHSARIRTLPVASTTCDENNEQSSVSALGDLCQPSRMQRWCNGCLGRARCCSLDFRGRGVGGSQALWAESSPKCDGRAQVLGYGNTTVLPLVRVCRKTTTATTLRLRLLLLATSALGGAVSRLPDNTPLIHKHCIHQECPRRSQIASATAPAFVHKSHMSGRVTIPNPPVHMVQRVTTLSAHGRLTRNIVCSHVVFPRTTADSLHLVYYG